MITKDYSIVGLTQTSVSLVPVPEEGQQPSQLIPVSHTVIPATVEATQLLNIGQVMTLTLAPKVD